MPTFDYQAFDRGGELVRGSIDATTLQGAEEQVRGRGLTPFKTQEKGASGRTWWKLERGATGRPSSNEIAAFARDLALLVAAEVPLERALRLLSSQSAPQVQALSSVLLADVLDGASFSEALARRGDVYSSEFVNAVRAGEVSGKVGVALARLADLLQRRQEVRAKLRGALVYPAILIVLGIASTAIVLSVLVPSLAPIFTEAGLPLPAGLKMVVDIGENWLLWVAGFAGLAALLMLMRGWARKSPQRMIGLYGMLLRLPGLGRLLSQVEAARFARTMSMLLDAGVPLLAALGPARDGIGNLKIRQAVTHSIDFVRDGDSLSRALERSMAMPELLVQMLGVGEEAGKPQVMLARVADLFEQRTYQTIERLMTLLTPMLTVLIALVVGGLVFAVMNAILGINDLATR
jgi:general secretion pathway protein F